MSVSKTLSPARLYIGLGGSGAKTLVEFVQTLIDHQEHGQEAETHMAFVLIDTDAGELRDAEARIRKACERVATKPIIRAIHTSEGVPNFSAFCANRLEGTRHEARVRDAWWYQSMRGHDPVPFTAERMKGMADLGAGQCPVVSTFFAWNSLNHIGDVVKGVVDDLKRFITLKSLYQNWVLHTSIVGSLAGGTGRGCWHLVAYKVREVLAQIGRQTSPVGYFFDASIFEDLLHDPARGTKMKINSLTGFSELTGWMRNETENHPFLFRLPSLDRPTDPTADVIDVERIVRAVDGASLRGGVHGHSPLNEAFVIFKSGKAGTPRDKRYYYQVVANAMYARLIDEIASDASNRVVPIGGLGAASIVVPISEVRKYVQDYVPAFCAHHVLGSDIDDAKSRSDSRWDPEATDAQIEEFVTSITHGIRCDQILVTEPSPDPRAVLWARAWHACQEVAGTELLGRLGKHLAQRNYTQAEKTIREIEHLEDADSVASEAVDRAIAEDFWGQRTDQGGAIGGRLQAILDHKPSESDLEKVWGRPSEADASGRTPVTPLGLAIRRIVESSYVRGENQVDDTVTRFSVSLAGYGTKAIFLRAVIARLENFVKWLESVEIDPQSGVGPGQALKRARSGIWPWSIVFASERDEVQAAARRALERNIQSALKTRIVDQFRKTVGEVRTLLAVYETVAARLAEFRARRMNDLAIQKKSVFWTDIDFESLVRMNTDELYERELLSEQRLKPYYQGDAMFAKKLAEVATSRGNRSFGEDRVAFAAKIDAWLTRIIDRDNGVHDGDIVECRHIIDENMGRLSNSLAIPPSFYKEQFGFFEVVKEHVEAWGRELAARAQSPHQFALLKKAFDIRFGMDYPCDKDGTPMRRASLPDEVCVQMALTLGQRTDLLYEARRDLGEQRVYDAVTVILPQEEAFQKDGLNKKIEARTQELPEFARPGTFTVIPYDPDLHAGGNPYLMIAYTHSAFPEWKRDTGIDRITSLRYHTDREVHEWLEACEDAGGKSWFVEDDTVLENASNSFGLGFVSPQFVRDDTMARLRWRPWLNLRTDEARHRHALDLVAYSFLEVPKKTELAALAKVHEERAWRLPLLRVPSARGSDLEAGLKVAFERGVIFWDEEDKRRREHDAVPRSFTRRALHGFVDDLKSEECKEMAEAIANEAVMYLEEVVGDKEFELRISPRESLWEMFTGLRDRVQEEIGHLEAAAIPAETKEKIVPLYRELLDRVHVLRRFSLEELQGHYESIRSHFQR